MPTQSTLTSPLGTPVYAPDEDDRSIYARPSRIGQIVPLVVGGIGVLVIVGGALLYGAGVIGAPELSPPVEDPGTEPSWEVNPEFSKSLGVLAMKNLEMHEGRHVMPAAEEGSLLPPRRLPEPPGVTVSPPRADDTRNETETWDPPVKPKAPPGSEDVPKSADPQRSPPNGYAD